LIVRSFDLRPRPGRYDDALGLISEGVKLAERHGAGEIRLTQAKTAGSTTGMLVLTCEFENMAAYGAYLDEATADTEQQSWVHRTREAEAPFTYESTAVLSEIDLGRADAKGDRGQVLDVYFGRSHPGRWDESLDLLRQVFDLRDQHGSTRCRLFQLYQAGEHSGLLCAVIEYGSMNGWGTAGDAWFADETGRSLSQRMHDDPPWERVTAGLFTEITLFS
jgi:hypothetical protein